jgi:hypothetical protein
MDSQYKSRLANISEDMDDQNTGYQIILTCHQYKKGLVWPNILARLWLLPCEPGGRTGVNAVIRLDRTHILSDAGGASRLYAQAHFFLARSSARHCAMRSSITELR